MSCLLNFSFSLRLFYFYSLVYFSVPSYLLYNSFRRNFM
ncbi:hypothetical protein IFM89_026291 [Coptis chinensis]|uniref:Uncharacterized protein n=1 Tax=Coptis chinensis TaxID=261450 RepID=A0A835IX61_9MAGN|nr:hypothetical protein IFM89_026291 [Coptis chinensis]